MNLFFDTETTGKANFNREPDAADQPRLVQLAAILADNSAAELASVNLIIRPTFTIPDEASNIHGITTAIALQAGVPLVYALQLFGSLACISKLAVAHNSDFDVFILAGEFSRMKLTKELPEIFCTMKAATPVCKIPGNYGFKWPKLQEAYVHAFGKEFIGAHDALADVRACKDLYYWLKARAV